MCCPAGSLAFSAVDAITMRDDSDASLLSCSGDPDTTEGDTSTGSTEPGNHLTELLKGRWVAPWSYMYELSRRIMHHHAQPWHHALALRKRCSAANSSDVVSRADFIQISYKQSASSVVASMSAWQQVHI